MHVLELLFFFVLLHLFAWTICTHQKHLTSHCSTHTKGIMTSESSDRWMSWYVASARSGMSTVSTVSTMAMVYRGHRTWCTGSLPLDCNLQLPSFSTTTKGMFADELQSSFEI